MPISYKSLVDTIVVLLFHQSKLCIVMKTNPEKLWLGDITHSRHQISMVYGLDRMRFTCSIWLSKEIDLMILEQNVSN